MKGQKAILAWDQAAAGTPHLVPIWKPWASPRSQSHEGQGSSWMGPGVWGIRVWARVPGGLCPDHTHLPAWTPAGLLNQTAHV